MRRNFNERKLETMYLYHNVRTHCKNTRAAAKGGEIQHTKSSQLVAQHCFVASFSRCFAFFTLRDQLVEQQNICCRLKKFVSKSRAQGNFERQILALLLVFHQTLNL